MGCTGTMINGPGKRSARCGVCGIVDWEANEGDRCRDPATTNGANAVKQAVIHSKAVERGVACHCCGESFATNKPHDPQRDYGFGTCDACHGMVAASWTKHGFPGVTDKQSALDRLARYA